MKQKIKRAAAWFGDSSGNVKLSMVIMGAGQFRYGAKGKGVCFFLSEVLMICYMAMRRFFYTGYDQRGCMAWRRGR